MKHLQNILILILTFSIAHAQNKEAEQIKQESKNYTYKANKALEENSFSDAEAEYRKAISKDGENAVAKYNLGNAYYENESYEEAFSRYKQASEVALTKAEKHSAYHNMGNVFMKNKEYAKAVEAYKMALRNNPTDDETRYNFALAKDMLEKNPPKEDDKDKKDKDKKEEDKEQDKKDQDNKDKDKNEDQGDKEKDKGGKDDKDKDGEGDKEKEKNKQDDKKDQNKSDQKDDQNKQQQQPKPNQLSPQQVKSLLQAMNNAEKKTQDKLNEKKGQGIKVKAEKDW